VCRIVLQLSVVEMLRGSRVIAVTGRAKTRRLTVVVGAATVSLAAGGTSTVQVKLNATGRRLLRARHTLPVRLTATQRTASGPRILLTQRLTFKAGKKK